MKMFMVDWSISLARAIPQIDTARAEKNPFRTETTYLAWVDHDGGVLLHGMFKAWLSGKSAKYFRAELLFIDKHTYACIYN